MSTSNASFIQGSSTASSQSTTTSIPDEIIIPDSDEYYDPLPIPTTTRNRIPRSQSRSASARSSRAGSVAGSLPGSRAASVARSRRPSPSRMAVDRSSSRSKRKGKQNPAKTEFEGQETEMSAGPSRVVVSTTEDAVDVKGKGKGKKRQRSLGSEDKDEEREREELRPAPPRRPFGWRSPSIDSIPPTQDSNHPPPPDSQTSAMLGPFTSTTELEHISARPNATANVGGSPTFSDILNNARNSTHNSSSTLRSSDLSFTDTEDDDLDIDESFLRQPAETRRLRRSSIPFDEILNGPGPSSSSTWFLNRDDDDGVVHSRGLSSFASEVNPFEDYFPPPPPSNPGASSSASYGQEQGREQHASTSTSTSVSTSNLTVSPGSPRRHAEMLRDFVNGRDPFDEADWYPEIPSHLLGTLADPSSANFANTRSNTQSNTNTNTSTSTSATSNVLQRRADSLADLFRDAIGEDHESYIIPDSSSSSNTNANTGGGPSGSGSGANASVNADPRWEWGSPFGRGYGGRELSNRHGGGSGSGGVGAVSSSSAGGAGSSTSAVASTSGSGSGPSSSTVPQPAAGPPSVDLSGANADALNGVAEESEITEEPSGRKNRRSGKGRSLATWSANASSSLGSSSGVGATAAASSSSSSAPSGGGAASASSSSTAAASSSTTATLSTTTTTTAITATVPKLTPAPPPAAEPLSEYTCPICFFPPTNATITPCGHVCCGECLFSAVKAGQARNAPAFAGLGGPAGLGGFGGPGGPMGLVLGMGRGRGRGGGGAGQGGPTNNGALCPVCRAPIPGWDGRGGGVVGLKVRTVISI